MTDEGEKFITDRDKLLGLLNDFGITPKNDPDHPDWVRLEEGHGNVTGYYDFYAIFKFDSDGEFTEVGVWE